MLNVMQGMACHHTIFFLWKMQMMMNWSLSHLDWCWKLIEGGNDYKTMRNIMEIMYRRTFHYSTKINQMIPRIRSYVNYKSHFQISS